MITLRGATWQNPRGYEPLVAAARAWVARTSGIHIDWQQFPWYEFEDQVFGRGENKFDLVMFDHPWTGALADSHLLKWNSLVPPSYLESLRGRVVAPSAESYQLNGDTWGLPLDGSCHAGLFRQDLVEYSELPRLWEDVGPWAQAHHHPPHHFGLVLSLEGVLGHCLFLSMLASLGYPAYLNPENPTCNRAAAEYVLTTIRDLLPFTPPGSTKWGPWDIYERFCGTDMVAYSPSIFAYANYFQPSGRGRELRLFQVPGFTGCCTGNAILGGVGLGITTTCKYVMEASAYGSFLMEDATQLEIFPSNHGQPAAKSAWNDERLNAETNGFYKALGECMKTAYVRPTYSGFHKLELAGGRVLQGWWDGNSKLGDTLDAICSPG